ncbi:MAG: ATP-binding protein [Anaerolineae bacterium]|nr:ATP-binding protein [Anaerolineales bacterium]MCQ3977650.1 ATP-binding protein [Anaerolineae bacterium]
MEDFEKLGAFYLGRPYNLKEKKPEEGLLLYDSKDLVTHAVCVGMTGSGKTGLCIGLIEEAAIDGVPVILIDPKGDLGNLLLTFPQLQGSDFLPWVNQDDARQKGLSPEEYAAKQAELWQKGLAGWGQSGERIQRLRDAAEFMIYTPGSNAGLPVSILKSFAAPPAAVIEDNELMRDRVSATATSLLGLVGIQADPVQSREHILLSTILDTAWRQGQDLDLAGLIGQVQTPPVSKIGVLDLETFYSGKDRFGLVMALNNLLASPGFNTWLEGESLDIGQILYTPQGKPRVAIFSIAHLSDSERMFFVSLLLNQILAWTRSQSGTTSLRAILYMDEIFGYLPPVGNPPAKLPMLTLLKQARAFGLGVVLATQNPVDLDYKALANTGTWFIGRLQTERDKARLLEGLEGAAASTGSTFDRQAMEQTLAGLGNRVFLMNNVHEDAPVIFETRWALSYLRGPLTRDQIKTLMDPRKAAVPARAAGAVPAVAAAPAPAPVRGGAKQPPALPPDVPRYFIPRRGGGGTDSGLVYQPRLLGVAKVRFADAKSKVDVTREVTCLTPITNAAVPANWADSELVELAVADLEKSPEQEAHYAELPSAASQAKSYAGWNRDLTSWLYQDQALELLRSPSLGAVSQPDEDERDFRVRLQQAAREQRDDAVEKLRQKYAPKIAALQERLRKAEQRVEKEKAQASQAGLQTVFSIGATLLGAFTGRKIISSSTISKVSSAARKAGQAMEQSKDVGQASETVEAIQQQLANLQAQFADETAVLEAKIDPQSETFETVAVKPRKSDISVQLVALVWAPYWQDSQGQSTPAWG